MYITDHIFPVLPVKHLVNQDGEPITPHKLETGTKPSVSNPHVLFCTCVVLKATCNGYVKWVPGGVVGTSGLASEGVWAI